jgi:hypothetical protein
MGQRSSMAEQPQRLLGQDHRAGGICSPAWGDLATQGAIPLGCDQLTALRLKLRVNGYRPVPISGPGMRISSAGKRPVMVDWRRICADADEAEVCRWAMVEPNCTNTGLLCGELVGVDLDIPVLEIAERIEALAVTILGRTSLRRIGQAPKMLLAYRTITLLPKMVTPELFLPDGTKLQVEIIGIGQQFVAYGVHPVTGGEYEWPDAGPDLVPLSDLPVVAEANLREFAAAAEALLRATGGRMKAELKVAACGPAGQPRSEATPDQPKTPADPAPRAAAANVFRAVNQAALASLDAWVPQLFPRAKLQTTGAWRVTSAELGRTYEEDLSIHPNGVQDFGPRVGLSPIDVVIEFGGASTVQDAMLQLCEWLGRPPADFGRTRLGRRGRRRSRRRSILTTALKRNLRIGRNTFNVTERAVRSTTSPMR